MQEITLNLTLRKQPKDPEKISSEDIVSWIKGVYGLKEVKANIALPNIEIKYKNPHDTLPTNVLHSAIADATRQAFAPYLEEKTNYFMTI